MLHATLMAAYLQRGLHSVWSNLFSLDGHCVRFCDLHFLFLLPLQHHLGVPINLPNQLNVSSTVSLNLTDF